MLRRISAAIAAGRRAVTAPARPVSDVSDGGASVKPAWALILFEPAGPGLAAHVAFCSRRGLRCLVLSQDIPPLCIGSREILFEFLPWPAETALGTPGGMAAANDHCFRRLSQVFAFWHVVGCDWGDDRALSLLAAAPDWAHPVVLASRAAQNSRSQAAAPVVT